MFFYMSMIKSIKDTMGFKIDKLLQNLLGISSLVDEGHQWSSSTGKLWRVAKCPTFPLLSYLGLQGQTSQIQEQHMKLELPYASAMPVLDDVTLQDDAQPVSNTDEAASRLTGIQRQASSPPSDEPPYVIDWKKGIQGRFSHTFIQSAK